MENYEYFLEEYLEIAKEGAESTLQGVKRIGLLIFRSLLVVILVPFWLVGKRERHLTPLALDGGDSAPLQAVSTPEVLSPSLSDSASHPAAQ